MANNQFSGNHAKCRTCGHFWTATYQSAQTDDCEKCDEIYDDYPELFSWILSVVRTKIEDHEDSHRR